VSVRLQLRLLETFVAIVEEGTLAAASSRLYKTQGAVSQDLKLLERQLATPLIDRSGQRIRLTKEGEALLPHAREVLLRIHDIEDAIGRVKQGDGDVVRVGSLPSVSSRVVEFLADYRGTSEGDLRFSVVTAPHDGLIDRLCAGTLDFAVSESEAANDLVSTDLGAEFHVIAVRRDDDLATNTSISPLDLADRPVIAFIRETPASSLVEQFFAPIGRYPPPVFEVDDYRLMRELVRARAGYGLLPVSSLTGDADLIGIPPSAALERKLVLLKSTHRLLSKSATDVHQDLHHRWRMADLELATPERVRTMSGMTRPLGVA
jgi:DNA-binding transcriptional LysR family regulator